MKNSLKNITIQLAATSLLLSIAKSDDILEDVEINIIKTIITDFFQISDINAKSLIKGGIKELENSIDLFHFGKIINKSFNKQDKIDFISCIYEVAYADGDLHYLEQHTIKKIANILHLERNDLINAKEEIIHFLDI